MKTYQYKKEGFNVIQKKAILVSIPVVIFITGILIFINYPITTSEGWNALFITLLILVGAGSFGVAKGLNRQKEIFNSYTLSIDGWHVQREQLNTPTIKINRNEIKEIAKNKDGSFWIKGLQSADQIYVSNQIENYNELEEELSYIQEIKTLTSGHYPKKCVNIKFCYSGVRLNRA
jgi:hypothetical protein